MQVQTQVTLLHHYCSAALLFLRERNVQMASFLRYTQVSLAPLPNSYLHSFRGIPNIRLFLSYTFFLYDSNSFLVYIYLIRSQGKPIGSKSGRSCSNMTSHSVHSTRRGPLRLNIWFPSTRATVVALLASSRNHSFSISMSYSFRVADMSSPHGQMIKTSGSVATTDSTDTRLLLES